MENQDKDSHKACTPKAVIVLILFIIFGIASLIIIIILVKKTENNYNSYIIGDKIIETDNDTEVHYYKVNTNISIIFSIYQIM